MAQSDNVHHGPTDIQQLVAWAKGRMQRDNDSVWAIVGNTGKGKSSLATLLMRRLQDHPIIPAKQFIWQAEQLQESARSLPEFSALCVDEAIVGGGNRRRAMSKDNVGVMEYLNTCRTYHQAVLFLAPQFGDLDMSIQTRCTHVIDVIERGRYNVYEVEKVGGVMERGSWAAPRFQDVFPDPAEHPEKEVRALWGEYKKLKEKFSMKGKDPLSVPREKFRDECYRVIDLYT